MLDAGAGLFSVGPGWSHTGTGSLARVDIATGSTLWTQQLPTGWLEVRAAVRGLVLAFSWVSDDAASTTLFALDAANGSVRWSVSLPVAYRSGRALDANEAGVLVSGATGVWELDPDSGAIRWAASQELPPSTQPSAVLAQGVAIVRAPDGSVVALERVTGAPARWQRTDLRLHRTSELIRHGELVFCDTERGELHVLDPASAREPLELFGRVGLHGVRSGRGPRALRLRGTGPARVRTRRGRASTAHAGRHGAAPGERPPSARRRSAARLCDGPHRPPRALSAGVTRPRSPQVQRRRGRSRGDGTPATVPGGGQHTTVLRQRRHHDLGSGRPEPDSDPCRMVRGVRLPLTSSMSASE
ncbi:MAG: PQQ-binding-like beta-propeller repeat protein [Sandaracinaceae bacterium]|nr:PQQ-binding-like beta-propeller repeat protein [Sandaracinaceae bacterium]